MVGWILLVFLSALSLSLLLFVQYCLVLCHFHRLWAWNSIHFGVMREEFSEHAAVWLSCVINDHFCIKTVSHFFAFLLFLICLWIFFGGENILAAQFHGNSPTDDYVSKWLQTIRKVFTRFARLHYSFYVNSLFFFFAHFIFRVALIRIGRCFVSVGVCHRRLEESYILCASPVSIQCWTEFKVISLTFFHWKAWQQWHSQSQWT